jgi:hypothetical protein
MTSRPLLASVWALLAGLGACSDATEDPCKPENHCRRRADGSAACEPGYVWADEERYVCVQLPPSCEPCTPPRPECEADTLVTFTPAGCNGPECVYDRRSTECALGCDASAHQCVGCSNECAAPGATQCHDGRLRTCHADATGCLSWGPFSDCAEGFCEDASTCGTCDNGCSPAGVSECQDGAKRTCIVDGNGCLAWSGFIPCATGACADSLLCTDAGGSSDTSCSVDGFCWVHPQPTGNTLGSVWGTGGAVWIVGNGGTLLGTNGVDWSFEPASLSGSLNAVSGSAANRVWAVGDDGVILRFDGSSWAAVASPTDRDLHGVWCAADHTCWAVGDEVVLRYQSDAWSEWSLDISILSLYAVFGISPDDVWAVGYAYGGAILHWDGTEWEYRGGHTWNWARHRSVWASGPEDVWVVNDSEWGGLMRWTGGDSFESVDTGSTAYLDAVFGFSAGDVWVVGEDAILHYDGEGWTESNELGATVLLGLWGASADDLWAVGNSGVIMRRTSSGWSVLGGELDLGYDHYGVVTGAGAERVWAGGSNLGLWDGNTWTIFELPAVGAYAYTVAGLYAEGEQAWAAGTTGGLLHFDGSAWSVLEERAEGFAGMWASGATDMWFVDEYGYARHWNGDEWTEEFLGVGDLAAIHGSSGDNIFVVGTDERVFHYDGDWQLVHSASQGDWLTAVWTSGPTDTWAGGSDAVLHHCDGATWDTYPTPTWQWITGIWGSGPDDVWAVATSAGGYGVLLHWDGVSWAEEVSNAGEGLGGVWGSPAADIWLVGADAGVLRGK